jgi:hypothetical protein
MTRTIYIVTNKVQGYELTILNVQTTLEAAKAEVERIDKANSLNSAGIVIREVEL